MAKFLLLIQGDLTKWEALSETDRQENIQRYIAFSQELKAEGRMVDADGVESLIKIVTSSSTQEVKIEPGMCVTTGYFLIEADDWDHAVQTAQKCPALLHGEQVAVHKVGH